MKLIDEWDGDLNEFMKGYVYQPELTAKLDEAGATRAFDQHLVNEIVLWKVNRYATLSPETLAQLNALVTLGRRCHREAGSVLLKLLCEPGIDLPMASTLLRFKNPRVFQIIDRHAYRALYGEDYPLYSATSIEKKVVVYFNYLDKLALLAESKKVEFEKLDRVLYIFDKRCNGKL